MYACPGCGANIKFDPATQMMVCSYCGKTASPDSYMSAHSAQEMEGLADDEYQVTYYTCPQCGGELITEDNTAATFCSYCGSSTILEMRVGKEKKPDYVIPFMKTRKDCEAEYKKTLKKAIFAPSDMKSDETIERFRGIYMPYWIYGVEKHDTIAVKGEKSHRSGDYIYTKHYRMDAKVDASYKGISYDASSSFEDRLSESIAPFDLSGSKHFNSAYFSGFYADTSDVDKNLYVSEAEALVDIDITDKTARISEYSAHGASKADIQKAVASSGYSKDVRLGMFPVWFLANQHGDRVSYAVVNGQTGKIAMDLPIDIKKYAIGSLIIATPLFLLFAFSGLHLTPNMLLIVTVALSLIALIWSNKQANALFVREMMYDDKGYNSRKTDAQIKEDQKQLDGNVKIKKAKTAKPVKSNGANAIWIIGLVIYFVGKAFSAGLSRSSSLAGFVVFAAFALIIFVIVYNIVKSVKDKRAIPKDVVIIKAPAKVKGPIIIKPIISMVLCVLILLFQPASDLFYYGAALISIVMVGITTAELVVQHNKLTSRKLPQFNKRGGEEHEND